MQVVRGEEKGKKGEREEYAQERKEKKKRNAIFVFLRDRTMSVVIVVSRVVKLCRMFFNRAEFRFGRHGW